MRILLPLTLTCLLFIAMPASACGGGNGAEADDGGYRYCHDYWIHVGDESNGVHANEKGQFLIAIAEITYLEQDVAYNDPADPWDPLHDHFLSMWNYWEGNGMHGEQRADEVCNNTPEGQDSDVIIC